MDLMHYPPSTTSLEEWQKKADNILEEIINLKASKYSLFKHFYELELKDVANTWNSIGTVDSINWNSYFKTNGKKMFDECRDEIIDYDFTVSKNQHIPIDLFFDLILKKESFELSYYVEDDFTNCIIIATNMKRESQLLGVLNDQLLSQNYMFFNVSNIYYFVYKFPNKIQFCDLKNKARILISYFLKYCKAWTLWDSLVINPKRIERSNLSRNLLYTNLSCDKIKNYIYHDGKKIPIKIDLLVKTIMKDNFNFPKKVGNNLFYIDEYDKIQFIKNKEMFNLFMRMNYSEIDFTKGCVQIPIIFEYLKKRNQNFDFISSYEKFPQREDVLSKNIYPSYSEIKTEKIDQFLSFFEFKTLFDRVTAKALIVDFFLNVVNKPIFFLRDKDNSNTFMESIEKIFKNSFRLNLDNETKSSKRNISSQIMNENNEFKDLIVVENENDLAKYKSLIGILNSRFVDTRFDYDKQNSKRPNKFTWIILDKELSVPSEIVDRVLFIDLDFKKEKKEELDDFIKNNSEDIKIEARNLTSNITKNCDSKSLSDMVNWKKTILKSCCKEEFHYYKMKIHLETQNLISKNEVGILNSIFDFIKSKIPNETRTYLIKKSELHKACLEKGLIGRHVGLYEFSEIIDCGIDKGMLGALSKRYKYGGKTMNGGVLCWVWGDDSGKKLVHILTIKTNKAIKIS